MISRTPNRSRQRLKQLLPALLLAAVTDASGAHARAQQVQPPAKPVTPRNSVVTPAQPRNTGPTINRNLIVLDPAHGGPDTGGKLLDQSLEKDVTLALATRLRPVLAAAGFTVISTRDADLQAVLTTDQRAELSNRQHAAACLILHATSTGSGVHLYISSVQPTPTPLAADVDPETRPAFEPIPWDMAQAGFATQSLHLQTELFNSLNGAGLPSIRGRGPVRPLDNVTCPAVVIELAPLRAAGGNRTPVTDAAYQQRLVDTLSAALQRWRNALPVRQKAALTAPVHPATTGGGPQ